MNSYMNTFERAFVHNRARWYLQRFWEIPILQKLGMTVEGSNIIEVGCGTGFAARQLVTRYKANTVHGIDCDPQIIQRAIRKNRHDKVDFTVADCTKLPFKNISFDMAIGFGLLHHVPTWQTAVQEIHRVLRPGGLYALDDFTSHGLNKKYHQVFDHPRHNRFTTGQLLSTIKATGFDIVDLSHRLNGDVIFLVARKK